MALAVREVVHEWQPRGAADRLWDHREPEVLLAGPAGTGKSRGALEYVHHLACQHPKLRVLMTRKTRTSLTQSALKTWENQVLHPLDRVTFRTTEQEYRYPNGSTVVVGGLDKPSKIMSSEYDLAYVQEATELTEEDWESITTRLRAGILPWQQLVADCNPVQPTHWLKQRVDAGKTRLLESRHEDNPVLWDRVAADWTPGGRDYIAKLDALTGVRKERLRWGRWAAAEGLVYEGWDAAVHLIDRFAIPLSWPRYWVCDFGFTNPFCWQAWAADPDGRLYRYQEIYQTQRLVEDHARLVLQVTAGEPRPQAVVCDHDAEGRATFEKYAEVTTTAAHKAVQEGVQAVAARLQRAGDGQPRVYLLRDSLVGRDAHRVEAKRPTCTEEEVDGYVWDTRQQRKRGEEPLKEDDHGMDCLRYLVAHVDLVGTAHVWRL